MTRLRLTTVIIVLMIATTVSAVTFDGDINPADFFDKNKWEKIACRQIPSPTDKLCLQVLLINTDKHSVIPSASIIILHKQNNLYTIIAYSYVKNNILYGFILKNGHYKQIIPVPA